MPDATLSAYATGTASKEPEPIPRELIPAGFTAADCHIVKPAAPIFREDSDGRRYTVGKSPGMRLHHIVGCSVQEKSVMKLGNDGIAFVGSCESNPAHAWLAGGGT